MLGKAGPQAAADGFGLGAPGRGRVYLRRDLGIGSFGVNAFFQASSGEPVIGEHDELGPGASRHEELYVVVQGSCTFTIDGEELEAPQGAAVFVGDPSVKRGAVATADETIVLVVGGRPGEPFVVGPGEALAPFFGHFRAGEHEDALAACREALALHPGNPLVLYNIACLESRLGHPDEALAALGESLAGWPAYRELAATDDDLDAIRDDPRFRALVG